MMWGCWGRLVLSGTQMHILERLSEALSAAGQCVTYLLASARVILVILGYMMWNVLKHSFLCYCHFCNMKLFVLWYVISFAAGGPGMFEIQMATVYNAMLQCLGSLDKILVLNRPRGYGCLGFYVIPKPPLIKSCMQKIFCCFSSLSLVLCRRPRYHLTVFGRNAAVRAQMWQRLPLLLACKSLQLIQLRGSI